MTLTQTELLEAESLRRFSAGIPLSQEGAAAQVGPATAAAAAATAAAAINAGVA